MMLVNGVTYVPLRAVGEAFGAKIGWDKATKTATLVTKV
ncbi:stalk domain-containing protein [Paenibacillus sp. 2KB_20]